MSDKLRNYFKTAALGLACLIIYFGMNDLELTVLDLFNIDFSSLSVPIKVTFLIIFEIIIMSIIMFILNKSLSKDIKDMKNNHKKYFKKYFKFWLISIGIMMISNAFITLISGNSLSGNEEALRSTFKISPLYIYFSSVIFAPVVEELVFRRGIKTIIPNKYAFIFISGFVFGGLHIISSFSGPIDLLYLIPYCAPGFAFAYILADSDNVLVSMALHLMHNGSLMALQFMLLFFS